MEDIFNIHDEAPYLSAPNVITDYPHLITLKTKWSMLPWQCLFCAALPRMLIPISITNGNTAKFGVFLLFSFFSSYAVETNSN